MSLENFDLNIRIEHYSSVINSSLANFEGRLATGVQSQGGSGINEYITEQLDPTLSWDDVKWLVNFTRLPVIVKGILTQEDAVIAADMGVQGIWVSNHGARQLDSVPASVCQEKNSATNLFIIITELFLD